MDYISVPSAPSLASPESFMEAFTRNSQLGSGPVPASTTAQQASTGLTPSTSTRPAQAGLTPRIRPAPSQVPSSRTPVVENRRETLLQRRQIDNENRWDAQYQHQHQPPQPQLRVCQHLAPRPGGWRQGACSKSASTIGRPATGTSRNSVAVSKPRLLTGWQLSKDRRSDRRKKGGG